MDTFLISMFSCLMAAAAANTGYNYQKNRALLNRPTAQFSNNMATVLKPPFVSQYLPPTNVAVEPSIQYLQSQFAATEQVGQPSQYFTPITQIPVFNPSGPALTETQYNEPQQRQTIISSNVYIHSAPEETEEIFADGAEAAPIKRNYRVLFVKAPIYNLKLNVNSLKQAQAAHEDKTVIYVLSKKPDISNLQNQLTAIQTEPKTHKPEVFFIKYRTQAEANRAQQDIKAQYDALGGSTNISDEGFATAITGPNFIQSGSSNQQRFIQSPFQGSTSGVSFGHAAPSLRYLPAKRK